MEGGRNTTRQRFKVRAQGGRPGGAASKDARHFLAQVKVWVHGGGKGERQAGVKGTTLHRVKAGT